MSTAETLNPAHVHFAQKNYDQAFEALYRLLVIDPTHAPAITLAARCLHELHFQAQPAQEKSSLIPSAEEADMVNGLGVWFYNRAELPQAEHAFRHAIVLRPAWTQPLSNLGLTLRDQGRYLEAEVALRSALSIAPDDVPSLINLGVALGDMGRISDAEAALRMALSMDSRSPEAHNNLGCLQRSVGLADAAFESFRQALTLRPDFSDARANLGSELLRRGEYEAGWAHNEARYSTLSGKRDCVAPSVTYPQWNGESLAGKSLLIWPEQGYGDMLQFCRYLPLLRSQGATHVSIVCHPALRRLFQSLQDVDHVYSLDEADVVPKHDY